MKKTMAPGIRGKRREWLFTFYADPRYLDEWRADGLDIDLVENVVPQWAAWLGLARLWCALQDALKRIGL